MKITYNKKKLKIALIGLFCFSVGIFSCPNSSKASIYTISKGYSGPNSYNACSYYGLTSENEFPLNIGNKINAIRFYSVGTVTSIPQSFFVEVYNSSDTLIATSSEGTMYPNLGTESDWVYFSPDIQYEDSMYFKIITGGFSSIWGSGDPLGGGEACYGTFAGEIDVDDNPAIEITVPQSGSSIGYFSNWEYKTYNIHGSTSTEDLYVVIRRATSSTSTSFIDDSARFPLFSSSGSVFRTGILEDGVYYAQAVVLRGGTDVSTDEIVATSDIISWTSDGDLPTYYPPITSTTTIASSTIECNSGNLVGDGFCLVLKYTLTPSEDSLDRWGDLWETIKSKPPMGYLVVFINELEGLNASSTTSTYALADLSDINFFSDLKVGVGGLFILITIFYTIKRFKHIRI